MIKEKFNKKDKAFSKAYDATDLKLFDYLWNKVTHRTVLVDYIKEDLRTND